MTYRLHGFCQSGNTYKVALMLRLLGEKWSPVFVDFLNGATRRPEWRAEVNEMGEAPVLEDGKLRLTQSGVILNYLATKHRRFGGRDEEQGREILRWILFDNHKFTSYFATYRFMKSFAPTAPDPAVMAFLKARIDGAYAIVNAHLVSHRFMAGDEPTIADLSVAGYVFYPEEESGLQLMSRYSHIAEWRERIRALPGWGDPYEILPGERVKPRW